MWKSKSQPPTTEPAVQGTLLPSMSSRLLTQLNPQQQAAVLATEGPVLILAGAGSGKTRTLTHRIAYLLEQGKAQPAEIVALTFTNKAAREMKERVQTLLNGQHAIPEAISTFHSLGARLLRQEHQYTNRSAAFTILDTTDSEGVIKRALTTLGISPREWSPRTIRHHISRAKNAQQAPADVAAGAASPLDEVVAHVFALYEQLLVQSDAYDFDDLIAALAALLAAHPEVRQRYQQRWKYVSVDEYQDTNGVQDQLLRLLLNPAKNICVVGDDYQAIYSWRGAKVDHILKFAQQFPGCSTVYLTRNYRSTPHILRAANHVIAANVEQMHKKLWTAQGSGRAVHRVAVPSDYAEAYWVRQQIEEAVAKGRAAADCVILYRTNAQSRLLEEQFLMHRLPYTIVGGFRFYERREIKDSLALLQWWVNPRSSVALRRLASSLLSGIGPKTLARLEATAAQGNYPLRDMITAGTALTARQRQAFSNLVAAYQHAREQTFATVAELLQLLLEHSGYAKAVKAEADGEERWENIEELLNVAAMHTDPVRFVEEIALLSDIDEADSAQDRVTCMTLHAAKGLEFPCVFIVGCEEGLLPHSNSFDQPGAIEEERRLLYVGMTRAKEELSLSYAGSRTIRGEVTPQLPSRFLEHLPEEVQHVQPAATPCSNTWQDFGLLARPASGEISMSTLEAGNVVTHPSFGQGVVIQVAGNLVTCVFPSAGVKTIDSSIVPVTVTY